MEFATILKKLKFDFSSLSLSLKFQIVVILRNLKNPYDYYKFLTEMSTSEIVTSMAHKIICFKLTNRGEIVLKLPTWILKFRRTFIAFIRKNARFYIITRNSLFICKLKQRQRLLQLRVVWQLFLNTWMLLKSLSWSTQVEQQLLLPSISLKNEKTSLVIAENKPVHTRLQQNFGPSILAIYWKFWGTSIISA